LEIESVPNDTACAVEELINFSASSIETPSLAMMFPL